MLSKKKEKILKFPDGFLWGTATSAHQIEGGLKNNWSEWEKSKERIEYLKKEGKNPEDFISGSACDSYNRYEEDLDLNLNLNCSAYRFSLAWSRIEPEEGRFNEQAIEHYIKVLKAARARNIEPLVTLWHWPIPLWLRDKRGWRNKKTVYYFKRYCEKVVTALNSHVKFWVTINEPLIFSTFAYGDRTRPPQGDNLVFYIRTINNLIKAHKQTYLVIKKINPSAKIGISKNCVYFENYGYSPINYLLKKGADWVWNFYFLNKIKNYQDFIGLNYYHRNRIKGAKFNQNENKITNDMGWEIYPEGIYYVLRDLKKYKKPIYITENGLADAVDSRRADFINNHLKYVHKAISEGVDVRGYFHWSLLDNFEWAFGWEPKFGLYAVDRKTFKRTARPSAKIYAEICQDNKIILR